MIDWMTLSCDPCLLSEADYYKLRADQNTLFCVDPQGQVVWESPQHTNIRSDSHQLTMHLGSVLRIMGSPTRVGLKRSDNVFGSGDPVECAKRMIEFVESIHDVSLPPVTDWKCSRIDVTHNYHLGDLTNVKTALSHLRNAEGGRYQVRSAAESVYWSVRSTVKSGKAYAKGEHMRYLASRGKAFLNEEEIQLTQGLLRLELSLKRHFMSRSEKAWFDMSEQDLNVEHDKYFSRLIGSVEITEVSNIENRCIQAALDLGYSEGLGKSTFMSWTMIRSQGFAFWSNRSSRSTYFRHKRILEHAGLAWADLCAGNVIPLRRHKLTLGQPVTSWAELRKVA